MGLQSKCECDFISQLRQLFLGSDGWGGEQSDVPRNEQIVKRPHTEQFQSNLLQQL